MKVLFFVLLFCGLANAQLTEHGVVIAKKFNQIKSTVPSASDSGKVWTASDSLHDPSWQPASGSGSVPLVLRQDTADYTNYALLLDNEIGNWIPSIRFRAKTHTGATEDLFVNANVNNPAVLDIEQDINGNYVSDFGFAGDSATGIIWMYMSTNNGGFALEYPGTGNWTLTVPAGHGTAGQVLTDDGTGVTSWTTPSSGSPYGWKDDGGTPVQAPTVSASTKGGAFGDSASVTAYGGLAMGRRTTASAIDAIALGSKSLASGNFSVAIGTSDNPGTAKSIGTVSIMGTDASTSQTDDGQHGYNWYLTQAGGGTASTDAMNVALGYNVNLRGAGNVGIGANSYNNGSSAGYGTFLGFGTGNAIAADAKYITLVGGTGDVANSSSTATLPHCSFDTAFVGGTTVGLYQRNAKSNLFGDANDTTVGGAFSNATRHILDIGAGGIYGNPARFNALTVLMNGNVIAGGTITATNFFPTANYTQSTPADPTGTTSATPVMMGLAGTITPTQTGTVEIIITGTASAPLNALSANIQIAYGTGAAPANGDAATGTTAGNVGHYKQGSADLNARLGIPGRIAIVTGLTLNTAYWIDLQLASSNGVNAVNVYDITIVARELH